MLNISSLVEQETKIGLRLGGFLSGFTQ